MVSPLAFLFFWEIKIFLGCELNSLIVVHWLILSVVILFFCGREEGYRHEMLQNLHIRSAIGLVIKYITTVTLVDLFDSDRM